MMKKFFHKIGLSLLILFLILILGSAIIYAQDYQTYYKNGYEYFLQGKYEMAEQYYKRAIELNPDFENAHYWLGKVYKQTDDYGQAIEQWKEVLRINPRNQYAFQNLTGSFKSTSRVQSDKANDYLNEGIEIIGNPEEYLFRVSAPSVDSLLSSLPYFKRAAGMEPDLLESFYWIGETYRVLGEKSTWQFTNLAIENYKRVIDIEETANPISFEHPSPYWRSYVQLTKIYSSLGLKDKEENLWLQLEKAKSLPYKQVLERKGYFGFDFPSRIEVSFKDGDKIENWIYSEKDITFAVINGEVEGEKEKEPEQSEIETKIEESIPEEKDN
ncbi:MAG: tetratricopeptide repeat protein [Candidatus Lokiarchaeota archaeon]|nr:tetratricopeptide repeat protein [Candidatus Lokiarchaeota archaeon]